MRSVRALVFALAVWVLLCSRAGGAGPGALPGIPTPCLPSTSGAVDEMLRLADVAPGDRVEKLNRVPARVKGKWRLQAALPDGGRNLTESRWRATRIVLAGGEG